MPLGTHTNKETQMPTTNRPNDKRKPTPRQLNYLRDLAMQTGTSFEYPYTFGKAKSEIRRLIALKGHQHDAAPAEPVSELVALVTDPAYGMVVDFDYAPDHAFAA
jgi:hypothetical protein